VSISYPLSAIREDRKDSTGQLPGDMQLHSCWYMPSQTPRLQSGQTDSSMCTVMPNVLVRSLSSIRRVALADVRNAAAELHQHAVCAVQFTGQVLTLPPRALGSSAACRLTIAHHLACRLWAAAPPVAGREDARHHLQLVTVPRPRPARPPAAAQLHRRRHQPRHRGPVPRAAGAAGAHPMVPTLCCCDRTPVPSSCGRRVCKSGDICTPRMGRDTMQSK
jgi:hypothetical protein